MGPGELSGVLVFTQPGQHGAGPEVPGSLSSVTLKILFIMLPALWGGPQVLSRNLIYDPKVIAVNTLFPNIAV